MSWGVRLNDAVDRLPISVCYGLYLGMFYLVVKNL